MRGRRYRSYKITSESLSGFACASSGATRLCCSPDAPVPTLTRAQSRQTGSLCSEACCHAQAALRGKREDLSAGQLASGRGAPGRAGHADIPVRLEQAVHGKGGAGHQPDPGSRPCHVAPVISQIPAAAHAMWRQFRWRRKAAPGRRRPAGLCTSTLDELRLGRWRLAPRRLPG